MTKIISVVGARPNFMKIAPVHKAFLKFAPEIKHLICHTGQHYDAKMSQVFFGELELPHPDFYLGVGGGSHAVQTANIMIGFEKILLEEKPDMIIVVGDVNSTIACTLTAAKLNIPTIHIEAGLRSFDRAMPEEINRILTDSISNYLFVSEKSGMINLENEGISSDKVFFVGNCMIDSLCMYLPKTNVSEACAKHQITEKNYILATLHRPSNVDDMGQMAELMSILNELATHRDILFPIHPRTKKNLDSFGLLEKFHPRIKLTEPLGYIEFLGLMKSAELVITDSGGIQEETTYLGVPCITLRKNTERPATVEIGTNILLGDRLQDVVSESLKILSGEFKSGRIPELWDGNTAQRIIEIIKTIFLRS